MFPSTLELQDLMIWSGTRGLHTVRDLMVDGDWGTIEKLSANVRTYHRVGEEEMSNLLEFVKGFLGSKDISIKACEG